jgi:rod shape determining protein RodA
VYWLVVGGLFGTLAAVIDYRRIERFAYALYGIGIGSLVLVLVLASDIRGSSRWIELGRFAFQPSEFMKIFLILAIARKLADDPRTEARTLLDLLPAAMLFVLPAGLVMLQPDFGTSMIYAVCALTMLALARLKRSSLVIFSIGLVPVSWGMWHFGLRDYQKGRILSFLNPEADRTCTPFNLARPSATAGCGVRASEKVRRISLDFCRTSSPTSRSAYSRRIGALSDVSRCSRCMHSFAPGR